MKRVLDKFRGDLEWVHRQEDRKWAPSKPYWPGGNSGVTLRPGVDLGYCDEGTVRMAYLDNPEGAIINNCQWKDLRDVFGIKGREAREKVKNDMDLRAIRIRYDQGLTAFPYVAEKYWDGITERFPDLKRPSVPGAVQTALLSLAFNRGIWNNDLEQLRDNIGKEDWQGLGEEIANMQQRHELTGIRVRRRKEGKKVQRVARLLRFSERQGKVEPADVVPIN